MDQLTFTDYLSKHIPLKISLRIVKETILQPTHDFNASYFPAPVRCMLLWEDYIFLDHNYNIILPPSYRSQLIGLISLCRYPLRIEFVNKDDPPPEYNNDYLHRCLWAARIKEQTISNFSFHTIESLNSVLPSPLSKSDLSNNCFQNVTKTARLNQKHFTNEVLKTFNLNADEYKKIRSFEDSQRLQTIGLLQYFQIPLKQKLLSKTSLLLPSPS